MRVEKLCIGYPWDSPFTWTAVSHSYLNMERPPNSFWVRGEGWCSAARHNHIIKQAIQGDASHVLIVGADQVHPLNMIPRLIKRVEDGLDVVAARVPMRGQNEYFNWFELSGGFTSDSDGFYKVKDNNEIYKVDCIGSGVLMFPVYALDKLQKPYFSETLDQGDEYKRVPNQDVLFTKRLSEAGFDIWVDSTIKVAHGGWMAADETFKDRFNDWNKEA
jgi:hypothetical protein